MHLQQVKVQSESSSDQKEECVEILSRTVKQTQIDYELKTFIAKVQQKCMYLQIQCRLEEDKKKNEKMLYGRKKLKTNQCEKVVYMPQSRKTCKIQLIRGSVFNKMDDQQSVRFPYFTTFFLNELLNKIQANKKRCKQIYQLPQDQKFKSIIEFKCGYCGKIFFKPCSLGGHISKLHRKEKNAQKVIKIQDDENKNTLNSSKR